MPDLLFLYITIIFSVPAVTGIIVGASGLIYLLAGMTIFFLPCALMTYQLGILFPHEGALYNWTHKALGGFWSFFSGFCAWLSGALLIISGPVLVATYLQRLYPSWLSQPWQQGLVIIGLVSFAGFLATRRARTCHYVINGLAFLSLFAVPLLVLATLVWLSQGHHSLTSFSHWGDWAITPGTFPLFGVSCFMFLSTELPLVMAGELKAGKERKAIQGHLQLGTLVICVAYVLVTVAMLVVGGPQAAFNLLSPVDIVSKSLGKPLAGVMMLCILANAIALTLAEQAIFSRLLLVGALDGYLPAWAGKLNRHRIPAHAIGFQTLLNVVLAAMIFWVAPYLLLHRGAGAYQDFTSGTWNVTLAASAIIWLVSVAFLFIDVSVLFFWRSRRSRTDLSSQLVAPRPVLAVGIVVGLLSCLAALVETLSNSWVPQQIPTTTWWWLVGGLSAVCLVLAAVGGMVASTEAEWQKMLAWEKDTEGRR